MENHIKQSELLFGQDWGTLIVLDACRFDYFKEVSEVLGLKGNLICCDTEVKGTAEWYYKNWQGPAGSLNINLVTANPWGLRYPLIFDQVIRAWDCGADCRRVNPVRTMDFYRRYSMGKKTVIHFIPPHSPFITDIGTELYRRAGIDIENMMGTNWDDRENFKALYNLEKQLAAYGQRGHWDEIIEAYKDNLGNMLEMIIDWLPEFRPPVRITSDHGEVIGEGGPDGKGGYGHCHGQPDVIWYQRLVPWFECPDDKEIEERLRALGYVD